MKSSPQNPNSGSGEETLRLIAGLPAPDGLEDRVHAALHAAPRRGRVLAWPTAVHPDNGWMRAVAAAAIVFVVAGGGWGVYTRVQQGHPGKVSAPVIVMPARLPAAGGFSGAGAMRTPQTLPGPIVRQPAKAASAAQRKGTKKLTAHPAPTGGNAQPATATNPTTEPAP